MSVLHNQQANRYTLANKAVWRHILTPVGELQLTRMPIALVTTPVRPALGELEDTHTLQGQGRLSVQPQGRGMRVFSGDSPSGGTGARRSGW